VDAEVLLLQVVRDESFRKFWLCPNLQVVTAPEIDLGVLSVGTGIFVSEPKWIRNPALFPAKRDEACDF